MESESYAPDYCQRFHRTKWNRWNQKEIEMKWYYGEEKKTFSACEKRQGREHDRILLFFRLKSAISINPINNSDFTWKCAGKSVGLRGGSRFVWFSYSELSGPAAGFYNEIIFHVRCTAMHSIRLEWIYIQSSCANKINSLVVCIVLVDVDLRSEHVDFVQWASGCRETHGIASWTCRTTLFAAFRIRHKLCASSRVEGKCRARPSTVANNNKSKNHPYAKYYNFCSN